MTDELVFSRARVVLDDEVITGSVLVRDGRIADISAGSSAAGEDIDGDLLLPGIVELHTDHVEYHLRPRPGVHWEAMPALLAHDAQMTAAGATTVLDAVRLGSEPNAREALARTARELTAAITAATAAGALRADHAIHLRCEVSAQDSLERVEEFADEPAVRLASLMDHTPGQRQFEDVAQFRKYYLGKGIVGESEIDDYIAGMIAESARHSDRNRRAIAAIAREKRIVLAAHDDATLAQVEESAELGVRVAEFPTTVVAAAASVERDMFVVMGAPNIVRGGSQSGNVAAADLLSLNLLHILSSDYVPFSPLQAVFQLVDEGALSLPAASKLVSANPAAAVGMTDRGSIEVGRRADLIRVRPLADSTRGTAATVPVVRAVYREGMRVA